ncbi:uncharacterized protein FIBRA_06325 [Fibroporia radiculosa]|uniref:Uncharacterized protein n=1 Tax=Fibroporia radiculosa TaxID=599839 RepID=J4GB55_9APHY|nr:uncharacterized protein FIBRA_06325 [Fibroporia radiculosa]CCM04163.1 predicted protein [Fibroporia radiculosa]
MPGARDVRPRIPHPVLGHVNLMVDTLIANASADDLRAILRGTIATSPLSVASTLTAVARRQLLQTKAATILPEQQLFITRSADGSTVPSAELPGFLSQIRALYGAGLGFASLKILAMLVKAAEGVHCEEGSELEGLLASIDVDISQAIQSSKEEIESGRVMDWHAAKETVDNLREVIKENRKMVESRGKGYLFEQGAIGLHFWNI